VSETGVFVRPGGDEQAIQIGIVVEVFPAMLSEELAAQVGRTTGAAIARKVKEEMCAAQGHAKLRLRFLDNGYICSRCLLFFEENAGD